MITNLPELRAVIHDLTTATWSLASLGVLFDSGLAEALVEPCIIDALAAACPALSPAQIDRVLAVAAIHGVVTIDGPRYRIAEALAPIVRGPMRPALAADIRSNLMQPLALVDTARSTAAPATTWRHTDPVLLQAQGDASSVVPMMIKNMLGELATKLDLPGARFLDIGCGVAALSIAACRAFPALRVTGLDPYDNAMNLARTNVTRAHLADRIELRSIPIEQLADAGVFAAAWLPAFFIPLANLQAAIEHAVTALEPGGWLMVGFPGAGDPKQRAVWGLIAELWGGPTLASAGLEDMLRTAGLHDVRTLPAAPWAPQLVVGVR